MKDPERELLNYLRSKEQIGIIDVVRTRADSIARSRGLFEIGGISCETYLHMCTANPGVILYGVGRKIWRKVLKPEVMSILPMCKIDVRKQLYGYVDVYIKFNP